MIKFQFKKNRITKKNQLISNYYFQHFTFLCIAVVVIAIVSFIPIIKTHNWLVIGNDSFVPLVPENSLDLVYQWIDIDNGSYIGNNHLTWISIFLILVKIGGNIYQVAFLFQFLIFFLSGIGIYTIYNVFNKKNPLYGLLPAVFFILSPHLLDHMPYYQGTVGIIWSTLVLIKFLKYKNFSPIDVLLLSISLSIITDLPNPKYHFLLFVLFIVAILVALVIKLLHIRHIVRNLKYFILILLRTAYISVPLIHFGYSFLHTSEVTINTRAGYEEYGQTLDYGAANIYKMVTLSHITDFLGPEYKNVPKSLILFVYYSIPFIVYGLSVLIIPKLDLEKRKITVLYLILGMFFIFFSKSSNPPFGFIYEWVLSSSQFFAFMRTSAGIVIYAAVFYSLLLGIVIQYCAEKQRQKNHIILLISLIIILTAGFPVWTGKYFERGLSHGKVRYGIKIPGDYFTASKFIKNFKLDTKLDIYPYAQGYQINSWDYYGYIIYPWIFDKPIIAFNKTIPLGAINSFTNTRYLVHDKSIGQDNDRNFRFNRMGTRVFASKTLDIYRKTDALTIPHFYTPTTIRVADDVETSIKKRGLSPDVAFYKTSDVMNSEKFTSLSLNQPFIEYKKINPTKFRVRIHKAQDTFQLLFSENFHPDWQLYMGNTYAYNRSDIIKHWENNNKKYTVKPLNEADQASKEDVEKMIRQGIISSIGEVDSAPEFISKQFLYTVQNDNLQSDRFYETFTKDELTSGIRHAKVNSFANSWIVDTSTLCRNAGMNCIENADGSYDFELILEFWPQKLKNMTYVISIGTGGMLILILLSSTLIRGYKRLRRKP